MTLTRVAGITTPTIHNPGIMYILWVRRHRPGVTSTQPAWLSVMSNWVWHWRPKSSFCRQAMAFHFIRKAEIIIRCVDPSAKNGGWVRFPSDPGRMKGKGYTEKAKYASRWGIVLSFQSNVIRFFCVYVYSDIKSQRHRNFLFCWPSDVLNKEAEAFSLGFLVNL